MKRPVELVPYNPVWANYFEAEAKLIEEILGPNLITIHHIGSTSIPGIMAKPIIDMMPVVSSLEEVDKIQTQFLKQGYIYRGEYGIVGRRYIVGLKEDGSDHRVHVHIFQDGHDEVARHLVFRDYLRKNLETAKAYEKLKMDLRTRFNGDRNQYQRGKADFCENILRQQKR